MRLVMARRAQKREITIDEFDAWVERSKAIATLHDRTDERGGPADSFVPVADQEIAWPTDLLAAEGDSETPAAPFQRLELPATRNRLAG